MAPLLLSYSALPAMSRERRKVLDMVSSFTAQANKIVSRMKRIEKLEERMLQEKKELGRLLGVTPKDSQNGTGHQERLKLGGRYMGLTRHLSAPEKARVRKIRLTEGIEKAISEAERLNAH